MRLFKKFILILLICTLSVNKDAFTLYNYESLFSKSYFSISSHCYLSNIENSYNITILEKRTRSSKTLYSNGKSVSYECEGFNFNFEVTKYNLSNSDKDYYFANVDIIWSNEMSKFERFQDILIINFSENLVFSKDNLDGFLRMYSTMTMVEQKYEKNIFELNEKSKEYKNVVISGRDVNDYYYSSNYLVLPFLLPNDILYDDIYNPFYKVKNMRNSKFHFSMGIHFENIINVTDNITFEGAYIHEKKDSCLDYSNKATYNDHADEKILDYLLGNYDIECDFAVKEISFN